MKQKKQTTPGSSRTKPEANDELPGIHRISPADIAEHFGKPEDKADKESGKSSQDKEPSERQTSE
ncbi:MAG TPA: hypothetical protein PLN05_02930 [Pyrinomonadaceae bacterium]|jgi:hypothetical protein|nr:hypothetical protein [Acidobacteriota bacterium]MBP9108942.1 hypothetical protein [Pyrinomonadaceae bacterium]HQZ98428.1 hypothetical protein [Pyrinomonadaceae bacterium]HRA41952.1 hypothetical protein [Pyrinomonadaceae bacterium]HRJ88364.1 hypothetical protein [Pyrinomonadaceae bacterium]